MAGIQFDIEGNALTEEQVIQIEQRRKDKARVQELARREREASSKMRHSHVGTELAYALRASGVAERVSGKLATLSNQLYQEGQEEAGQILGALALGMQQAFHQQGLSGLHTPKSAVTEEERLAAMAKAAESEGQIAYAPLPKMPGANAAPAELAPEGVTPEQGSTEEPAPAGPEGYIEEAARQAGVTPEELVKRLEQGQPVIGTLAINGPDPDDMPPSGEPATSPEPVETQGAKEARARRAAKRQQS